VESVTAMDKPDALFNNVIQIGIVVSDLNKTIEAYRDILGVKEWNINHVDTATGKGGNFHNNGSPIDARARIAWVNIGNVELELIEPQDQNSAYSEFLVEHGPGIHHVMLGTSNYADAMDHMGDMGIATVGGGELQNTRFQMFNTQDLLGFICEIAEGDPLVPDQVRQS
jgi:methylmalonyl-CoA/ethylmalonyl-CoA epimerase